MKQTIKQFFWCALINPTSIMLILVLGFYYTDLIESFFKFVFSIKGSKIAQFFMWSGGSIYIYIMIPVYTAVILLNYFLFTLKRYKKNFKHRSFKSFLKIYFQSQEVYMWWFVFAIFPCLVIMIAKIVPMIFISANVGSFALSLIVSFFKIKAVKIAYLIFGFSLMILSHRSFKKLARGEKIKNSY